MTDDKNGSILHVPRNYVVLAILTVLGSTSSPFVLDKLGVNPFRTNPYDSLMAQAQNRENDRRFTSLAHRVDGLEEHVKPQNHPDVELRAALAVVIADVAAGKAERKLILANQNRILDRLDKQR